MPVILALMRKLPYSISDRCVETSAIGMESPEGFLTHSCSPCVVGTTFLFDAIFPYGPRAIGLGTV